MVGMKMPAVFSDRTDPIRIRRILRHQILSLLTLECFDIHRNLREISSKLLIIKSDYNLERLQRFGNGGFLYLFLV